MGVDRIACVVPFCGRTAVGERYPGADEILCRDHYKLASAVLRKRLRKVRRAFLWAQLGRPRTPCLPTKRARTLRLWELDNALWTRIKRQAIERAGGL